MKKVLFLLVFLMTIVIGTKADSYFDTSSMSAQDQNAPIGWGASVTGSADKNVVTVTTLSDLQSALSGTDQKTIVVSGTITFTGRVVIEGVQNKSIYGMPDATLVNPTHTATVNNTGILTLKNCSNIIIRNLTFKGAGAYDVDGNDNLTLQACTNIWIDHCDFQDGVDGNLDCNNGSDNICVSWCRFRYLIDPWSGGSGGSNDHRFSDLWGGGDSASGDEGKLNTTFVNCWWDEGCKQRMPRIRFGKVHILNCLYSSTSADYCVGGGYKSNVYIEKCAFTSSQAQSNPWMNFATSGIYTDYNYTLTGCTGADDAQARSGSNDYFVPSYDYNSYASDQVESVVSNATNGAGATLKTSSSSSSSSEPAPNFSITWSMANGAASTAVASVDDVVQSSSWAMSSKIEVNSTATYGGNVLTKFNPTVEHNPRVERNTDYYVEWTFRPFAGFTFTPTSVSFDAVKCGTGNPTIDVDFTDGTGVTQKLATNAAINRDGNDVSDSNPAINQSYSITTASNASGNAVTLRIYIGKCATNKQVALGRIVINGSLSGSIQTYTTVYNLAEAMMAASSNFEGNSGTLAATTADAGANAPELQVDATNGKLGANNSSWAQLNAGTVLTLPGVPKGAEITFALYNSTALTINGVAYTNGQTYTTTKDESVVMTSTTDGYIQSITVEGTAFVTVSDEEGYTNTWYFGKSNGAEEFALQKSAEYTYTVDGHSLVINTDNGKLNNASRTDQWAQCNNGTLFKVPVFAGAKLSWGKYAGGSETGFTIDGQLYNDYYIATEDGSVEMTASGVSYLSYIKIEPVTLFEVSGTISGGDINGKTIMLTAAGNGQQYEAIVASDAFTMNVPGGIFTPALGSDVTYVVSSPETITVTEAGNIGTITIAAATEQTVTGAITNAPTEAFTLTFTASNDVSHTATVNCEAGATSFSKALMPDTYVISSSVGTLSPLSTEAFTVVAGAVSHNIYFPEAAVPAATQQNITVDNTLAAVSANNYKTVTDALAAAKAGNISNPVITLTSGQTYREQVIVDQANVTLKTSGTEKATITFYYGIGYAYYSLNASGYYDKDRAMTRNSIKMIDPARWGCTVKVTNKGNNFKAENIIFENSFNQYYTEEEVTDGVRPNGVQSITYDRTLASGDNGYKAADSKAVTERAAAIAIENNPTGVQFYNCVFRGSQDTFYSSGKVYVKNCNIIGNTDYIFGGGYVVFDDCDLTIGGYSDKETSAYITAYKDGSTLDASKKYVFRDCTVKATDRQYVAANLGRDWGGAAASVYYFNLKNEIGNKLKYEWTNMGGGVSAGTADLHIYDFDPAINANYSATGATGANVNGIVSAADALSLYTGVVTALGFTPEHIYDIPLDETSYYNALRIKASNGGTGVVTLTRSIAADNWSTIVLPFAVSNVENTFGAGTKVARLTSVNDNKLTFENVTSMNANEPYMIKVATDFNTTIISDAVIQEDTPAKTVNDVTFQGVYEAGNIPAGAFFVSGNKLYKASDDTNTIKPFRAYFTTTSGASELVLDFGDVTAITNTNRSNDTNNGEAYNLAGQRVAQPTKGLYIVNGKKVIIK